MNGSSTAPLGTKVGELDAEWLPGEGLWLHAPEWTGSVNRLRSILFGWHAGSWYGEQAAQHVHGLAEGLLLPPLIALDYMAAPMPVRLLQYSWSPRANVVRRAAEWMHRAIRSGWYAPDLLGWSQRKRTWKAVPPERDAGDGGAAAAEWKQLQQEASAHRLADLEGWLSEAVEQALADDTDAADAMRLLLLRTGADLSAMAAGDEGDWLIAIGWTPDDTPFRIALQLLEPVSGMADGEGWHLAAVGRGRLEQELTLRFSAREAGRWQMEGDQAVPDEWLPWLGDKLQREAAKWLAVLPELKQDASESAEAETEAAAQVSGMPELGFAAIRLAITEQEAWHILQEGSVRLLQAGCHVILPGWWEAARTRKLRIKAKVKSSVGNFEEPMFGLNQIVQFDWKLAVGNADLSEAEFMRLAADNRRLLQIGGEWVHLDPGDVKLIRDWMKRRGRSKGLSFRDVLEWHLRGGVAIGGEDDDDAGPMADIELNEHLSAWLERLQHIGEIPAVDKPRGFLGELRPYQLEGISWLAFLRQFGLGGCLADDMGLGKTIQYTGYLLHVKEQEGTAAAPSLLVCPTSVIGNWEKELERFAPDLNVYLHYGPRRIKGDAFAEVIAGADLVITSYALTPLDEEELSSVMWNSLCLDEAQNIKNVYTKQTAAIRRLQGRHRIALTGTPMENRLTELWSIHDYINPGYLGSLGEFRREIVLPIEKEKDKKLIAQLQHWVKPFMLRRLKKDPAIQLSLPEKNEQRMFVSLTAEQAALYEQTVSELLEGLGGMAAMKRRGLILAALTKLKQLCDHPLLLLGEGTRGAGTWQTERSGKLVRLLEMVDEIAAEGERCLIFTQFIGAGELIKAKLEKRLGMPVPYLHGGVAKQDRDAMIASFQDPKTPGCAFVLSLKAGGTGLNLTAANHVFHFDRWWNPAVENQATDRAFRIGQTKNVQVHKFVTIGTLEERIDDMITRKQALSEQVVGQSEGWITELDQDELRALFTLRKTWAHG